MKKKTVHDTSNLSFDSVLNFFYYLTLIQKNSILISSFAGNPTKL